MSERENEALTKRLNALRLDCLLTDGWHEASDDIALSMAHIDALTRQLEAALERAVKAEERCEAYKGQVEAGAKEIERLEQRLESYVNDPRMNSHD